MSNEPHLQLLTDFISDNPDLSVLSDPDKWNLLKAASEPEGVAALVAFKARGHLPEAERAWCDRVLTRNWSIHDKRLRQLDYTAGILEDAGVPVLSLKGPLLARRHYEPPFLRKPSLDLDLAVREADLDAACAVLAKAGYTLRGRMRDWLASGHHAQLTHPSRPSLELHFRLSHGALGIPIDEFFDRAVGCSLPSSREIRILGSADEVLHLVLHCAHTRFRPLFFLHEVRRVLQAAPPEAIEEAVLRAEVYRFSGAFAMVDVALRTRWGRSYFSPTPTWLHWRIDENLYRAFDGCAVPGKDLTLASRLTGRWLEFQTTDRASDGLRFLGFLTRVAWFHLRHHGWRKVKKRRE